MFFFSENSASQSLPIQFSNYLHNLRIIRGDLTLSCPMCPMCLGQRCLANNFGLHAQLKLTTVKVVNYTKGNLYT